MILLATVATTIPILTFGYFYNKVNSIFEETSAINIEGDTTKPIAINDAIISDNITNILLIGTDAREKNERGRSDAMIIATLDEKHKKIKLTSLARDTYVQIPGRDEEKLNHAYSYGGAKLLMNTIEHNLSIDISNYAIVDFNSFASIIDALGGITVDIKNSEIAELNKYIPESFEANKNKKQKEMKLIEKEGIQKITGYQALSYSRIRKNDSSIHRDNRQRQVMQSILNEVSNISVLEVPKLINSVLPYIKTDMDFSDIVNMSKKVLKMGNFNIEQLTFPMQEYSKNSRIKGKGDVIEFNKSKCLPTLHQFIFEDEEFLNSNDIYNSHNNIDKNENEENYDSFESWMNDNIGNTNKNNNSNKSENYFDNSINNESNYNQELKPEDYFNNNDYNYNLEYNDISKLNTDKIPFV